MSRRKAVRTKVGAITEAAGAIVATMRSAGNSGDLEWVNHDYGYGSAPRVFQGLNALVDGPLQDAYEGRPVLVALTMEEATQLERAATDTIMNDDTMNDHFAGAKGAALERARNRIDQATRRAR